MMRGISLAIDPVQMPSFSVRVSCLTGLALSYSMVTMANPRYSLAGTVTLSESQREELRSIEIPLILPTYIPPGFTITEVNIAREEGKKYAILFESSDNRCFQVEATDGAIGGGLELESTVAIDSKLFGSGYALHHGSPKDPELKQQFPESDLYSDWMERDRYFYRLSGALTAREEYDRANCREDLEPSEAVKVIEAFSESR